MSKLDDLLPKKYKGHKWELSDIFDRNGKNNAAYLYAVEKCNEIRRDFDPLDPILKEKFMEMAGINYTRFNEGELSEKKKIMSECYRFASNDDFDGYKEILEYFNGNITLDEAVRIIKRDTRHFAKRQLTWFKREKDTKWINKNEFQYNDERIISYLLGEISNIN